MSLITSQKSLSHIASLSRVIPVTDPARLLPLDTLFDPARPLDLEIGCGNGRFLVYRAHTHPEIQYLGIERMLGRVRKIERKARRLGLNNLRILRLEAFYSLYYLLPRHRLRTIYIFFPDPWPKRRHHSRRLFSPLFLDALWARLIIGGTIEIATDHIAYFTQIQECFAADPRFAVMPAMTRNSHEQTDFERIFRAQGLSVQACAYSTLPADEPELAPLTIDPEMEPKAGILRRRSAGVVTHGMRVIHSF